jgi:hypothetical protein
VTVTRACLRGAAAHLFSEAAGHIGPHRGHPLLPELLELRLPQYPAPLGLKRRLAAQWAAPMELRRA